MEVDVELSNQDLVANTSVSAQPEAPARRPRVAVVGTGFVASTTAYALLMSGTPAEIVIVDVCHDAEPFQDLPALIAQRFTRRRKTARRLFKPLCFVIGSDSDRCREKAMDHEYQNVFYHSVAHR